MIWLSADKVRRLFALQREAYETGSRDQARDHLLKGLTDLVRAQIGVFTVVHDFRPGGEIIMAEVWHAGFDGNKQRDRLLGGYQHAAADPGLARLAAMEVCPTTSRRADVLEDRAWYRNEFVNQVRLANGVDDVIYGNRSHAGGPHVGIGMNRVVGEQPFSDEDRELVDLVATESAWLFGRGHCVEPSEWQRLSRRERETLDCLLSGMSEKQIALRLGLSAHTVHTYVKRLHRRFEVKSRAELLAKFLRRR